MSNSKGKIPPTKVQPVATVEGVVLGLADFLALSKAVHQRLSKEKRLSWMVDIRIRTEASLVQNILLKLIGVRLSRLNALLEGKVSEPGFEERVKEMAEAIAPPKRLIVTPEEFHQERMRMRSKDGR